jgi:anti-anti-sigma factor
LFELSAFCTADPQTDPYTGQVRLALNGEIDLANVSTLERTLKALHDARADVRIDLERLSFIDVRGAAALVQLAVRLGPEHRLVLHRAPQILRKIVNDLWPSISSIEFRDNA